MIKEIHIPLHSPKWYAWRKDHVGGSDISTVLAAYNPRLAEHVYKAPIQYHMEMIGEPVQGFTGNVASNMGQYLEPININLYRYYDKSKADQMDMFANIKAKKIINKVVCRHNYVVNDKYPHLSSSPDGFVYADRKGILECKITTSMETNKYYNKVSPSHLSQCQHNLLVTKKEFCDLIMLIDGRWLEVITIEPDKQWQEQIIECSVDFFRKIIEARMIKVEYGIDTYYGVNPDIFTEKQKEGVYKLQQLEPELIGSDREVDFIKDMIKPTAEYTDMSGTDEQLELLLRRKDCAERMKVLDGEKNICEEKLRLSLSGRHRATWEHGYFAVAPKFYVHPKLLK